MSNQRTQDFTRQSQERLMRMGDRNRAGRGHGQPITPEQLLQAQAKQHQAEQAANEKLARLAQEQQRKRQNHPAKNPQQVAAQQKRDDKQHNLLAVKNYREVFLPGQVSAALDAQQLAPKAQQTLRNLSTNLLNDAWWSKQEAAQLSGTVKAYADTLTSLTAGLLGFELAAPPATPAPLSVSSLDGMLTKDTFDPNAATQLIREAALTERLLAGKDLAKAVQEFNALTTTAAASPTPQSDPKKLRKEVQKSLRTVNKELARYQAIIASSDKVYAAERALHKSTSAYLAKNGK